MYVTSFVHTKTKNELEPPGTTWNELERARTSWNQLESARTNQNYHDKD